ncbi:low molecular weight protein-tyrosine-phosphatase [Thalassotalea crassostreae]|uniref:low molecular weight protein-tyrosine-phosphatase n=1 Tax=Thalassotalea crassostreae TaxID=1763536 RepID=UPI000838CF00|nr:low molecular weight protein-tyrosine-phosphatase [Thalassotalea crassostreae]
MTGLNNNSEITSVLFVCMGNICRSPTAEAVFRHKANELGLEIKIDSAGTLSAHTGERPDRRSEKEGVKRGYSFDGLKARKVLVEDFERFSLILAMDDDNVRNLQAIAPDEHAHKIKLFLEYSESFDETQVPDPYYGGSRGFALVLDLIEDASEGLIKKLR